MRKYLRMVGKRFLFFGVFFILFSVIQYGNVGNDIKMWTEKTFNINDFCFGRIQWPDKSGIKGFFPLGFSKDGWFAYAESLKNLNLNRIEGICKDLPCYAISIFNIECKEKCVGDIDPTAGEKCKCFQGVNKEHLIKFGIQPLKESEYGTFPTEIADDQYDVQFVYKERAIFPKVRIFGRKWIPEFPETRVFLVSKKYGQKEIALIDHNHMGILPGIRPAGWIKSPFSDSIVLFLLCEDSNGTKYNQKKYYLLPFASDLKKGFSK